MKPGHILQSTNLRMIKSYMKPGHIKQSEEAMPH